MSLRALIVLCILISSLGSPAIAQNYSGDARKIALGGVGYDDNIATRMIEEQRSYSALVLPIGLIQLFRDLKHFDPDDDSFDPVLAMEYAASPLHFVFGRDSGGTRGRFVDDVVNGRLNRDLNRYRGFVPANELKAEGLAAPNWGATVRLSQRDDGSFHGFYVGAGPYLSARTLLAIDPGLTNILGSGTDVYVPNSSFSIRDTSRGQLALALTGGYRGRFALPGRSGGASREGIYVGVNYHYLKGFRYGEADMVVRFDTDAAGLLTVKPTTAPAAVDFQYSHSGSGFALDFGVGAVVDRWEFGFGANGVANRLNWEDLKRKRYTIASLVEGGDFVEESLPADRGEVRVELPVRYTGNVGYHEARWSAIAEVGHGLQGTNFHGGYEYRFTGVEVRGGGRYSRERWHPSGGAGIDITERVSFDVAVFSSSTNVERQRRLALALSLRFNMAR